MAIPYPKRSVGPRAARPSGRSGALSPVYPANERYWGPNGSPKMRPASPALLTPSQFNAPAVSYGKPLKRPSPYLFKPNRRLPKIPFGGLAKRVIPIIPAIELAEWAWDIIPAAVIPNYARPQTGGSPVPWDGYWKKVYGDYTYAPPYHNVKYGWVKASTLTQTKKIDAQAIPGGYYLPFGPNAWTWGANSLGLWIWNGQSPGRWAHLASYWRVGYPAAADNVQYAPIAPTPIDPLPPRWADPFSRPVGSPYGRPTPPPYRLIPYIGQNPYRSPIEQDHRGYAPPGTPPRRALGPAGTGYGWGIGSGPAAGYKPVAEPFRPNPRPRPAPRGTPERKLLLGMRGTAPLMKLISGATEALDAIKSIWATLPKSAKTGYYELHYVDKETGELKTYWKRRHPASATDKLRDIVKNWDKIDLVKAGSALVDNAIEDRIYGGIGKGAQKARRRARRDVNADFNRERAKQGRQYRKYVPRRKGQRWQDAGPKGRGWTWRDRISDKREQDMQFDYMDG